MESTTVFTDMNSLLEGNKQYLRLTGRHKADILSRSGIVAKGLPKDFSLINTEMQPVVEARSIDIGIGGASNKLPLHAVIQTEAETLSTSYK